jgi:hypothetical protein
MVPTYKVPTRRVTSDGVISFAPREAVREWQSAGCAAQVHLMVEEVAM